MSRRRDLTPGVVAFFVVLWALLTHTHIDSWNEFSRLAAVEALVERGTWSIDDTALGQLTGDKVFLNGHFYSDKPPVMTFVASGVYAILHRGFGLTFDSQECDPKAVTCYCFAFQCPRPFDWAYYFITLTLVGIPSVLTLALFYRSTAFLNLSNPLALLLTGVLGLGTLMLPYSLVLNNHVPTAACLFVGLYALLCSRGSASRWWLVAAGFATSLGFTLEFNVGPFLLAVLGVAWLYHQRRAWPFLVGCVGPVLLTVVLDWWMLGSLFPPQLHPAGYNYPGSTLYVTPGGTHGPANVLEYGFRMLVGDHGVFAFGPVLLWVVVAVGLTIRKRDHRLWGEAFAIGLASLAITLYILLFTDNFGGEAFGPRWFIAMTPALFFFAADPSLYQTIRRRLLFVVLSILSIFSAWQGASAPWHSALPPLRLETSASSSTWPIPLTSRQFADLPGAHRLDVTFEGVRARLMGYSLDTDTVHPGEPLTVTLYWQALAPISKDDTALFIHLINSVGTFAAQRDIFPGLRHLPTSYWKPGAIYADPHRLDLSETVYAPDTAVVQMGFYRSDGSRLIARSPEGEVADGAVRLASLKLVPRPGNVPNPTRVNFGDQVALVGYDLSTRVIRPGETVSVTLYWQALAPVQEDYSIFLHLTSTTGDVPVKNDSFPYTSPKRTRRWSPGEVMTEVRALAVPDYVPAGLYDIDMGVFSVDTGDRLPIIAPDGHRVSEQMTLLQVRVGKSDQ